MKKLLALILAAALALSLVACGGGSGAGDTNTPSGGNNSEPTPAETQTTDELDKNDTSNYVGVWETDSFRLTINKGGVGRYEPTYKTTEYYDLTWEVTDEVLVTQISFFGMEHKAVLELNEDASSLSVTQFGFPVYSEDEDVFIKQS